MYSQDGGFFVIHRLADELHLFRAGFFFAVGKPHRPTDAKPTGEDAARSCSEETLKTSILSTLLLVCIVIVLFGSGFLLGREFPRHHYERVIDSPYFLDTSTGRPCTLFRAETINMATTTEKASSNPFDALAGMVTIPKCDSR